MSVCTGACCDPVTIRSHTREQLRVVKDVERSAEAALLFVLLRPVRLAEDGIHTIHRCQALTAGGCALEYATRPSMCQRYPYGGDQPCNYCGASSDSEARGVALQVRS